MSETMMAQPTFQVGISESSDAPDSLVFTFAPRDAKQDSGPGDFPRRMPQYVVLVQGSGSDIAFDWSRTPDDPGDARSRMEHEATERINARVEWIGLVSELVEQVEKWGRELGWATRRIDKRLEDSRIGKHQVPALLMQEDTCRVLLEPIGRSAPGVDGVVDLYLMPAYDDIASLYYYQGRWNLHYDFLGHQPAASLREADALPLSKEALEKVLLELKGHAI
jgi:hypothetical protein